MKIQISHLTGKLDGKVDSLGGLHKQDLAMVGIGANFLCHGYIDSIIQFQDARSTT